ncbi:MAG: ribosomal-processing cysteine protease Prp [Ruminococcaceae bacterium]|nr:ribosomal-processing cysteine protease Prp [Oscillospiraceae bacterium]
MIHFTFFRRGGVFYGFEEQGHAGFAESGNDIVCSAVSAMTMLIINAIEVTFASDVDYHIDEKTTDIRVKAMGALPDFESDEKKRFAIAGLIEAYYLQLNDMLEDYYDYLDVDVKDD